MPWDRMEHRASHAHHKTPLPASPRPLSKGTPGVPLGQAFHSPLSQVSADSPLQHQVSPSFTPVSPAYLFITAVTSSTGWSWRLSKQISVYPCQINSPPSVSPQQPRSGPAPLPTGLTGGWNPTTPQHTEFYPCLGTRMSSHPKRKDLS